MLLRLSSGVATNRTIFRPRLLCSFVRYQCQSKGRKYESIVQFLEANPNLGSLGREDSKRIDTDIAELMEDNFVELGVNMFEYNTLIFVCCKLDNIPLAMNLLRKLQSEMDPNIHTYHPIIKSLCIDSRPEEAVVLLEDMKQYGIQPNLLAYTRVIHSFCRTKSLTRVSDLVQKMKEEHIMLDEVTYTILIESFAEERLWDEAKVLIDDFHNSELHMNNYVLAAILKVLIGIGSYEEAIRLYFVYASSPDREHDYTPNGNQLIKSLCDINEVERAKDLFANMEEPNLVSCCSLIAGLCAADQFSEISSVTERMESLQIEPNEYFFSIVMDALSEINRTDLIDLLLERFPFNYVDTGLLNTLLKILKKSQNVEQMMNVAKEHFYVMDTTSYNNLFSILCDKGKIFEAFRLFIEMNERGIEPNIASFNFLISGCCSHGEVKKAIMLVEKMKHCGIVPNVHTYTNIIQGCAKEGDTLLLDSFVREMKEKNVAPTVYTYRYYLESAKDETHLREVYQEMVGNNILPNEIIFVAILSAFSRLGVKDINFVIDEMLKYQIPMNQILGNTLLHYYCNLNLFAVARYFLTVATKNGVPPDTTSYNTFLTAYSRNGYVREVMDIMGEMKMNGISLDAYSYASILHCFRKTKRFSKTEDLLDQMKEDNIEPNIAIYNELIATNLVQNKIQNAFQYLRECFKSGINPSFITYRAFLEFWCKHPSLFLISELSEIIKLRAEPSVRKEICVAIQEKGNQVSLSPSAHKQLQEALIYLTNE